MTVFTSASCSPCHALKRYLTMKNVSFTELDGTLPEHAQTLINATGRIIYPTTLIKGKYISGLNYGEINKALNS